MGLSSFVCRLCQSFMHSHPTLNGWIKCNCGLNKVEKEIINLEDVLMGRDKKYPEAYTKEVEANLKVLIEKVNNFLFEVGITSATVTSGFRPPEVNGKIENAAKKSNHMMGLAVDLLDIDLVLWNKVLANLPIAQRHGLFFEDKRWTKTWVHFQCVPPGSGKRIFIPSTAPATAPDLWDGYYDPKFNQSKT